MNICIIGTGFVGVVTASVYASFGHEVVGLDIDQKKVALLQAGEVPFFEPGLSEMLIEQQQNGHLLFTTNYEQAVANADVIMVAVGTPSKPDGSADLKYIFATADSMAPFLKSGAIVVLKSTVPPGTIPAFADRVKAKTDVNFSMSSMPEFLREGSAVEDTLRPNRILIGATEPRVFETLVKLSEPFNAPIVQMSPESAQMAKYSANAYLATRISFINQIADLCEQNGADVEEVIEGMGLDKRIGKHYWYPGLGYGGSCFPKDVKELAAYSQSIGEADSLLVKMNQLNESRITTLMDRFEKKIGGWTGKKVAVLGLSFKPQTNDLREAPSIKVIPYLLHKGASVFAYDPKAKWPETEAQVKSFSASPLELQADPAATMIQCDTIAEATAQADVILSLIEWPEIINFDYGQQKHANTQQWFIDTRNQFSPVQVTDWGFEYIGIGR